jgi:hypothetical protein
MPLVNLPQFTEIEPKIVGPLTFKQFLFIFFAVIVSVFVYLRFPRFLSFPLALLIFGIGLTFAFLKIQGVPFYTIFLGWLRSLFSPKVLFWGKREGKSYLVQETEIKKEEKEKIATKREGALKGLITKIETKK